jgi:hypothetical protein
MPLQQIVERELAPKSSRVSELYGFPEDMPENPFRLCPFDPIVMHFSVLTVSSGLRIITLGSYISGKRSL